MSKQKKIIITILIYFIIMLLGCEVFATNELGVAGEMQFSKEYLEYLKLSDEEKEKVFAPRMYDIPISQITLSNPFKLAKMAKSSVQTRFSLQDIIPANMIVKNQMKTNSCWAFASLASLESNLALKDYKYGNTPKVYDFSERHMEYATSETFLDGINQKGFNRTVGEGGIPEMPTAYLTNGTGAINEEDMPFANNEEPINLSEIKGKEVITQVSDIRVFPSYSVNDDKTQIIQQMKEHIMNYGAINASIHGAIISYASYNQETGAIYCDNSESFPINHAIAVVGWDDNYKKENFLETMRPSNDGAWIIRNSWGTELETNEGVIQIGDKGFMYVSYEDANIYRQSTGIEEAKNEVTYENLYQYDQYGGVVPINFVKPKIYLANVFERKTSGVEYLTEVAVNASEKYTCKVYVNPNGSSKAVSDLQLVQLKTGESETFEAGYHTLEFLEPIKLDSDTFTIVLEIQGARENAMSVMMEFNYGEFVGNDGSAGYIYNNVEVENEKCFYTIESKFSNNKWYDTSKMVQLTNGGWPNFDTTIKAFTTSKILESIVITTPPAKTSYIEGQDFDETGMVVKAKYTNGDIEEITDFSITDGTDLKLGSTDVTIVYEGKSTTQSIEVVENKVEEIKITTPATKTQYWAGENFDKTGMVVNAVYTDQTTKQVTDYIIENGDNLKNGQTSVTISYNNKTTSQEIIVKTDTVIKLQIVKPSTRLQYIQGQSFDSEGMVVKAIYESGSEREITDFTIKDGINLQASQTKVTIEYEGQTIEQDITVIQKEVTGINVKTMPTKTEYLLNEKLDLTGGEIEISYNDGTKETLKMSAEEINVDGFNNNTAGIQTIMLTYEGKTTQIEILVKELEKPENSNFDNIKAEVKSIKSYFYTDKDKKENVVLDIEINNIVKTTVNEELEYYYYLSTNPNEQNIATWIKVKKSPNLSDKLQFEINTNDISNYEELANAETIYLYLKEVAIKNDMTKEKVSSSLPLKVEKLNVENYVDGVKTETTETTDNTKAPGTIPNAGENILIICLVIAGIITGIIMFLKYKDIELK